MKRGLAIVLLPILGLAQTGRIEIGQLLQVRPGGEIVPTNVVATLLDVGKAAADAAAADAAAEIAMQTAESVSNLMSDVVQIVNGLEGVGYVRGFLLDFGAIEEVNTNMTSVIVRFDAKVAQDENYVYSDIYTFFSEEPDGFPVCRWSASLGRDNDWMEAESVDAELTSLLVGNTFYAEIYRNRVRVPIEYSAAFFRVFAEAKASVRGMFFPVDNGISPGGREPLTATFMSGTNVIMIQGGLRVRPH